jgi:hypothetical protein
MEQSFGCIRINTCIHFATPFTAFMSPLIVPHVHLELEEEPLEV